MSNMSTTGFGTKDMEPENIRGEARSVLDLVEYQEGAVVSRTVLKKEKGTVTLQHIREPGP